MITSASNAGVFAENAFELHKAGFAVLPARGKSPIVKNWPKWSSPAGESALVRWAKRFPDANIAYVAEQSGLIIVDADDHASTEAVIAHFGDTPGKVLTRRGKHFLYRSPGSSFAARADLRPLGINADLKYGSASIVMAPPSVHPKGGNYIWDDCTPAVRKEVPPFRVQEFAKLLDRLSQKEDHESRWRITAAQLGFPNSSRGLALNKHLCSHAAYCDTLDEVIDVART